MKCVAGHISCLDMLKELTDKKNKYFNKAETIANTVADKQMAYGDSFQRKKSYCMGFKKVGQK